MLFEKKHSKQQYCTTLHYHNIKSIPHCQSTLEILFVAHGNVAATRQNEHFTIQEGHCLWLLPYEVHSFETLEENDVFVHIFSEDYLPDFMQAMRHQFLTKPVVPYLSDQLSLLIGNTTDLFTRKGILYLLAADVFRGGTKVLEFATDDTAVQKSMLFIQENYHEDISLKQLAVYLGYSYNYMSHLFHSFFPYSFREIVNMHRLQKAEMLLATTQTAITQIAEQVGFSTIRSFNLVFKKKYQISPSEYRKQTNNGKPGK